MILADFSDFASINFRIDKLNPRLQSVSLTYTDQYKEILMLLQQMKNRFGEENEYYKTARESVANGFIKYSIDTFTYGISNTDKNIATLASSICLRIANDALKIALTDETRRKSQTLIDKLTIIGKNAAIFNPCLDNNNNKHINNIRIRLITNSTNGVDEAINEIYSLKENKKSSPKNSKSLLKLLVPLFLIICGIITFCTFKSLVFIDAIFIGIGILVATLIIDILFGIHFFFSVSWILIIIIEGNLYGNWTSKIRIINPDYSAKTTRAFTQYNTKNRTFILQIGHDYLLNNTKTNLYVESVSYKAGIERYITSGSSSRTIITIEPGKLKKIPRFPDYEFIDPPEYITVSSGGSSTKWWLHK